jgi:hypothetical protein
MFGDYIDRGSAGAIFSSPTNPDQVIKIINLDSLDDFVKSMNNQQFKFFEKLEEQQKQNIKTPGLPKIEYTFTGEILCQRSLASKQRHVFRRKYHLVRSNGSPC